jgi:hypothetical protein
MAGFNRNTLVLNNVSVVRDVVTSTLGQGCASAERRFPAMAFPMRQPSQCCYPSTDQDTGWRHVHADKLGAASAAKRAGRSGCRSGFLASRMRGLRARSSISSRWSVPAWLIPAGGTPLASTRG